MFAAYLPFDFDFDFDPDLFHYPKETTAVTCPRHDFHIHTKYLGCANETMEVSEIIKVCEQLGVTTLAITDHLNTLDKLPLHAPIKTDIQDLDTEIEVYFGVELNFLGYDQGFAFSREIVEEYGFQLAIGGIHAAYLDEYDLKKIVDIQHKHHLKTCADPLVDALVHPYWFGKGEFDRKGWPWFDSMAAVPEAYARELAQASKDTGTAIEINACANLKNRAYGEAYQKGYFDYLSILADEGATFCVGSDAHDIGRLEAITAAWDMVERLGLTEDRIWRPEGEPAAGGKP